MNRITRMVVGGVAASCALATVANAQAKSGAWTLNAPAGEVHMTGIDYGLQRFSPLKQITTANVKDLKAAWTFSTGTLRGHEGNPLIVGNVMYVHTSPSRARRRSGSTCRTSRPMRFRSPVAT